MDGSSSMSSRGRLISARPMASICCSPPDRVPAFWARRSSSRGNRSKMASMSGAIASPLRLKAPSSRFSSTDMSGKIRRPSGEWATPRLTTSCAGTPSRRVPSKTTVPATGRSRPDRVRRVVVLPAPLVPMSVTT